ncbi:MAG: DUF4124 domain-containing protein [Burkholderiales bacterium]
MGLNSALLVRTLGALGAIVLAGVATSNLAAEVYRWLDERGVVNYSNEPPPKGQVAKDVRVVEDRLSIYTPEKRPEPAAKPERGSSPGVPREAPVERRTPAQGPGVPLTYDRCLTGANEVDCYGAVPYDGSPVFSGRRRPPRLVQPELPPGATAGNVTGSGGYIPGQSAGAPPAAPGGRASPPRQPGASFTLKDRERDSRH